MLGEGLAGLAGVGQGGAGGTGLVVGGTRAVGEERLGLLEGDGLAHGGHLLLSSFMLPRLSGIVALVRLTAGWLHRLSWLALLLLLTGCAARFPSTAPRWYGQSSSRTVDIDVEAATPRQAEALRRGGVQLPRVSERTAEPREHRDSIELRVTAVGFGLTEGGYLLYCEGLPLPVLIPESQVDLGVTSAEDA